ncbi:SWF or SNF family helicase [Streptomyces solincola]|uniref:SWF or SNF family helicase n=1 Tax=Streptomyces solincola TaxID=2100817 RepID=A0A2S9PZU3_9ACTN|nr:SWF or SNF family helicase [Streptomyces solincola]PRH79944.1 SWF or SNF family helicase [Streptomyces solincola]
MSDGYGHENGHGAEDGTGFGRAEERTFAAVRRAAGQGFARTWWGRAWLKALEDSALDTQQVKRGRRQVRAGAVGAVSVRPGRITAVVRDPDGTPVRGDVLCPQLDDAAWDRLLTVVAEQAGHVAALLEGDMPPRLVEDAAAAGVELLPGIGDLEADCACGGWDHCPHTVALCYAVARLLDEDPFVLLLLRGRGERWLLAEVQRRTAAGRTPEAPAHEERVRADEAFAARDILPALPPPPVLPGAPGGPLSLDTATPPGDGVDPVALEALAADAAGRAYRMLAEALSPGRPGRPPEPVLTPGEDAVRMAAEAERPLPAAVRERLAAGTDRGPDGLAAAAETWRAGGGVDALWLLEQARTPTPEEADAAGRALAAAWPDGDHPVPRAAGAGQWAVPGGRLRPDRDGRRWWALRRTAGHWVPAGPAQDDPAAAAALLAEGDD